MCFKLKWYIKLFIIANIIVIFDTIININILARVKDITVPALRKYHYERQRIFHRKLAEQLLQVEHDIVAKRNVDALKGLHYVKSRLDIRYRLSSLFTSFSLKENNSNTTFYPEKSFNSYDEYSPQDKKNPNLMPITLSSDLRDVITILINDCEDVFGERRKEKSSNLISEMRDQWMDVKIVYATDSINVKDIILLQSFEDVTVIGVTCGNWRNSPLQPLLSYVTSPYILFLSSLTTVTDDLNITRLLNIYTAMKEVGIVGMAERGIDGGWDYTCSQVVFKNAHLSVIDGYEYSKEACFFCDITSTSFMANTSLLRYVLPDSKLPNGPREIDWAIRLQRSNILTVTCPDVMVQTANKIMKSAKRNAMYCNASSERKNKENYSRLKKIYIKLAKKYEVNVISFHNKTHLKFSCSDINYNCNARSRTRKYILPPCCWKRKEEKLGSFILQTKNILVAHRIYAGSVVGAVKFKSSLPWDFDDDITFQMFDEISFRSLIDSLTKAGFDTNPIKNNSDMKSYFKIKSEGEVRFDYYPINGLAYSPVDNLVKLPLDIPCLLYGYYPINIKDYLKNSKNISNQILRDLMNKSQSTKEKSQSIFNSIDKQQIPDIKAKCFLLTKVRIGNTWVSAPFNPGLYSLNNYKDYLRHEAHWRFIRVYDIAWPQCFQPGHPMCLDIHPTDGNIPFL